LKSSPIGFDRAEFWWRIFRFNWFGHQSLFDLAPAAVCMTGHLPTPLSNPMGEDFNYAEAFK